MKVSQYVAPTSYPVTLSELKLHLKIDAGTMADDLTQEQSIAPGSHAITAGYALLGAAVQVVGDSALVQVQSGTNGATGTVDIKIQESDTGAGTWADWTGGAFTQITTANDNAIYEKEYTGTKPYIRTVAQVLLAACEFGTTITQYEATSDEDGLLTTILSAATSQIENVTRRQLVTATWEYWLDDWPDGDAIVLPFGNLASVTHVKYTNSAGTITTMAVTTDYTVELNGEQCGRVVLPYEGSWPTATLSPSKPITIRFVCGYTTVPEMLQVAVKFAAQNMWRHGGQNELLKEMVATLVSSYKLYDEFD